MGRIAQGLKSGSFNDVMPGWASPPMGYLGKSFTGTPITTEATMAISIAFACIRLLAGTLAKVPLQLFRDLPSGGKTPAEDIPEYAVLHDRANPSMTSYGWRRTGMVHALTWGNSFSERVLNGFGQLVELNPMRPDRTEVKWEDEERVYYYRNGDGRRIRMTQDQVFHVPGLGFDGLVGYPVLTLMRETIGSYSSAREFGQATFKNGARPAVVVTHPKTMSGGAIERLTAQMERLRGSGNAGKTVLIEEGGDFKELGFTPEDAQFIQTKEFELAELARWYGVPPHMVGLVDRSTSWGTGIEEQTLGFLTFTMDDWFVNWEQEIRAQLLWDTDVFAQFNRDAMLRTDGLKRAQKLDIERRNGVISADEWRALDNRNPLPDQLGETFLRPVNMTVVEPDGTTTRTALEVVGARNGTNPEVPIA